MTYCVMRYLRPVIGLSTLLAAAAGCGGDEAGPEKYKVTGMVTYGGKPIGRGDIIFEPKEGLANKQSMSRSMIRDGHYNAEIVGGAHKINIRDMTGNMDSDPEGAQAGRKALFRGEYRGDIEYPPISTVKEGDPPLEKDIEIPTTHR